VTVDVTSVFVVVADLTPDDATGENAGRREVGLLPADE
jgi:hypothetical protein